MTSWLLPNEGADIATLAGVPCILSVGGTEVQGEAYKLWGGGALMFSANNKWVTGEVTRWKPMQLDDGSKFLHSSTVELKIKRLPHGDGLALPKKAHPTDAGIDLPCAQEFQLFPNQRFLAPTGFAIELPQGYEGQIRPRSGLAVKHAITVGNAPGTIDANYRGEIKVLLINHGIDLVRFKRGDRIAQLVVQPVLHVEVKEVVELSETDRGAAGFGSSGVKS